MKKITKNILRNLIKEALDRFHVGTEKMELSGAAPVLILSVLKNTSLSDSDKAQEIYAALYQNRRKKASGAIESIDAQTDVAKIGSKLDATAKSVDPNLIVKPYHQSSWVHYSLYHLRDREMLLARDKSKYKTYSAYFSIGYKKSIKTITPQELNSDWASFMSSIVTKLANRIEPEGLIKFKHNFNIGELMRDQDNLKFYFSVPKEEKLSKHYNHRLWMDVTQALESSKYFSSRERGGASWATESHDKSYGQIVSGFTAEKILDRFKTKTNPTESDVKSAYNNIISQIDPVDVQEEFTNKYGIDLEQTS